MALSHDEYLQRVQQALVMALTLVDLPCQHVDRQVPAIAACRCELARSSMACRYSKPEVEICDSPELVLQPVTIVRTPQQQCLIEQSINSVRLSVKASRLCCNSSCMPTASWAQHWWCSRRA